MDGFELKLDTETGTVAVADHPPPPPQASSSARSLLSVEDVGTARGSTRSLRNARAVASKTPRTANLSKSKGKVKDDDNDTTLRQPIKNAKAKSARRLRKSTSLSSRAGSAKGTRTGRRTKKKSAKSLKRLAQQRELEMYRSQLRTEREKSRRELDSFRLKTEFLNHRHQTSADDKERELRDMRIRCRELEDKLASVTEELENTKEALASEKRRVGEYKGDDFRDANSARLGELEDAARRLLFNVAEERRLRLHCAQCDNPLVSVHSEATNGNASPGRPSSVNKRGSFTKPAAPVREDEQLVVFYPCRHARFCRKCARKMEQCQLCSRAIDSKVLLINSQLL